MTLTDAAWISFALGFFAYALGYTLMFLVLAVAQLRDPDARGAFLSFSVSRLADLANRAVRATGERLRTGRAGRISNRLLASGTVLMVLAALLFATAWVFG